MAIFDPALIQRIIPAALKNLLKPHYRTFYPNKLHVLFWVTFRCNYRCSYCPVVTKFDFGSVYPRESERTAAEWLSAFEKLPSAMIYVSGGEPFLYGGLPEFINRTSKHSILGVVTNGAVALRQYREVKKKIHLNVSFHREFVTEDDFLTRIEELREQFHLLVNIVATPENLPVIREFRTRFNKKAVGLHVDPFVDASFEYSDAQRQELEDLLESDRSHHLDKQLNFSDYSPKSCSAGKNYINILPNGDVYTCIGGAQYIHSPLVKSIVEKSPDAPLDLSLFQMGNIFDPEFKLRTEFLTCRLPCTSACDFDSAIIRPSRM